jgi:hypothetical protein
MNISILTQVTWINSLRLFHDTVEKFHFEESVSSQFAAVCSHNRLDLVPKFFYQLWLHCDIVEPTPSLEPMTGSHVILS